MAINNYKSIHLIGYCNKITREIIGTINHSRGYWNNQSLDRLL